MSWYRVREGQQVGQNGTTYGPGSLLQIPDAIARELGGCVDLCTEGGDVITGSGVDLDVARALPHEKVSIREQAVIAAKRALAEAETALAAEKAAEAASAAKAVAMKPVALDKKIEKSAAPAAKE